jgi:hypothetical protein
MCPVCDLHSANYRTSPSPWGLESVMYRVKKGQYMMYKHALLHGLNVSLALALPGVYMCSYERMRIRMYACTTYSPARRLSSLFRARSR